MGVTGLWKLIEPCGKPVPVETLEGKILAVDISIWLHQVVKGFQDNKGAALNNAHLLGLFHRLCKLLYYRIKPVFVFDGCVPQLKRDTIARRQQQRSKLNTEADRIQSLLLQSLAKEKIVQQALGTNAELLLTSPIKKKGANKASHKEDSLDDMFKLPELPSSSKSLNHTEDETTDQCFNDSSFYSEVYTTTSASADDSSFDESNPRHAYDSNIQAIDVKSNEFLQLPADVRHEILVDIKETRKQSSWGRLHELPSRSDDFSNFQMKRLLKRRDVQVSLETAEQEMGGRALTYAELTNIFSEEGILETDIVERGTKQITSDEHTRFLLVKDLKKKSANIKEEEIEQEKKKIQEESTPATKCTKNLGYLSALNDEDRKLDNEFDADLEIAIALSLEDDSNRVYDEKDYDYDSDETLKLSKTQRQQLRNATKGPARSYMIEYADLNMEEVAGILEKTQTNVDLEDTLDIERLIGDTCEKQHDVRETIEGTSKENIANSASQDIRLCVTDDSDATDSDLEEVDADKNTADKSKTTYKLNNETKSKVKEIDSTELKYLNSAEVLNKKVDLEGECVIEETPPCLADEEVTTNSSKTLNIQIDLSKRLEPEDDLFADIFADSFTKKQECKTTDYLKVEKRSISKEIPTIKNTENIIKENKEHKETKPLILNEDIKVKINYTSKSTKILSILDELNQQAGEIKNIKLENIKLSDSIIEILDDEPTSIISKVKPVVIEVCDSDDYEKCPSTPPPQTSNSTSQSQNLTSKSPNFRTPSKNHSITEFFNVNYVVKHTPDKPLEDETQTVPKVQSAFFVRKTPKSENKSGSNPPSPIKKQSKANKILFDEGKEIFSNSSGDKLDTDFMPLKQTRPNGENILNEAANILKSQKTAEELNTIALTLAKERKELENERNRQDRMGMSITQRMNSDCQDLLRLFGIPFIVAPMEAEAQCAFLDIVQLTNGTITDDSDIWLFGGRTVYKNFFAQNKHVMEFRSEQIEKDFNCDRKKLIQLACLVGSDYTTGIHGIGAVTALEILASFAPKESANKQDDSAATSVQTILATLQRFRNWWQSFKSAVSPPGSSARLALQKKLKNIEVHEGFPSIAVLEAYLAPKVDQNKDAFTWGYPDVESIKEFTRKTFGWTINKTEEILMPVLKKLNEKHTQQSIRNYFSVKNSLSLKQIRVSKRVQTAIEKMASNTESDDASEKPTKAKRTKKSNTASCRKKNEAPFKAIDTEITEVKKNSTRAASCSNQTANREIKTTSKRINIPETKEVIPQREKDVAKMKANKKLATEIFKNTVRKTKKRRA